MNELALFEGVGGGTLGSQLLGWRTVCGVEIEPYCREVILRRQEEGILEPFPIWSDIRTFDGRQWRGKVDLVSGGFPCQPFSVAGKQAGESDERNMWPDTIRVIREVRPRYCFLENVPNLLTHEYFGTILADLAESGYDIRWRCLSAAECGAPHRRTRLWIMAYSRYHSGGPEQGGKQEIGAEVATRSGAAGKSEMANATSKSRRPGLRSENEGEGETTLQLGGRSRTRWWDIDPADLSDPIEQYDDGRGHESGEIRRERSKTSKISGHKQRGSDLHDTAIHEGRISDGDGEETTDRGSIESFVGRVAHGVAYRVDRLKAIGNGQVPRVVGKAWELLKNNP